MKWETKQLIQTMLIGWPLSMASGMLVGSNATTPTAQRITAAVVAFVTMLVVSIVVVILSKDGDA
jgi:hypothetical protein